MFIDNPIGLRLVNEGNLVNNHPIRENSLFHMNTIEAFEHNTISYHHNLACRSKNTITIMVKLILLHVHQFMSFFHLPASASIPSDER